MSDIKEKPKLECNDHPVLPKIRIFWFSDLKIESAKKILVKKKNSHLVGNITMKLRIVLTEALHSTARLLNEEKLR